MFKFIMQSFWDEIYPAVIIYTGILGGAWALIEANKYFNIY